MFEALLNNPLILVLVIVAFLGIVVGITFAILKGPKAIARRRERAIRREQAAAEKQKKDALSRALDTKILSSRNDASTQTGSRVIVKDIMKTLNPNLEPRDTTKVEKQKEEVNKQQEAESQDVVSILQGKTNVASAYKKADGYDIKKDKEQKAIENAAGEAKTNEVIGILGTRPQAKVNVKVEKKKEEVNKLQEAESQDVVSILQGKTNVANAYKKTDTQPKTVGKTTTNNGNANNVLGIMGVNDDKK